MEKWGCKWKKLRVGEKHDCGKQFPAFAQKLAQISFLLSLNFLSRFPFPSHALCTHIKVSRDKGAIVELSHISRRRVLTLFFNENKKKELYIRKKEREKFFTHTIYFVCCKERSGKFKQKKKRGKLIKFERLITMLMHNLTRHS